MSNNQIKSKVTLLGQMDLAEISTEKEYIKSQTNILFADKKSWVIAASTYHILKSVKADLMEHKADTGIILINEFNQQEPADKIRIQLREGKISPLHFVAANAGAPISMICSTYKFQGPTLNFTTPLLLAVKPAIFTAVNWLQSKITKYVFLIVWHTNNNQHFCRNILLSLEDGFPDKSLRFEEIEQILCSKEYTPKITGRNFYDTI